MHAHFYSLLAVFYHKIFEYFQTFYFLCFEGFLLLISLQASFFWSSLNHGTVGALLDKERKSQENLLE